MISAQVSNLAIVFTVTLGLGALIAISCS